MSELMEYDNNIRMAFNSVNSIWLATVEKNSNAFHWTQFSFYKD